MDPWYATGVNNLPLEVIKRKKYYLTNTRGIQAKQVSNLFYPSYL